MNEVFNLDIEKKYSYADYVNWNFAERIELIRGRIFKMSPSPMARHQITVQNIDGLVWSYLRGKPCRVFHAPFDVRLPLPETLKKTFKPLKKNEKYIFTNIPDDQIFTVVQPDICVICHLEKIDRRGCLGAPDWIVEVISKETAHVDVHEKFQLYEEAGVKEYWLVTPDVKQVIVFDLNEVNKYQLRKMYAAPDVIPVHIFPDLVIDLNEVFDWQEEEY